MNPHLLFGYIAKAHGLKGELVVRTFDSACTTLDEVDRVWLAFPDAEGREVKVTEARDGPGGDVLISLEGVSSRAQAEALKGAQLHAFREDLPPPDPTQVFQGDLVGLAARTAAGEALGVVAEVWSSGPVPNLVIRDGTKELMVPLVDEFVLEVNVPGGFVVVEPPEFV